MKVPGTGSVQESSPLKSGKEAGGNLRKKLPHRLLDREGKAVLAGDGIARIRQHLELQAMLFRHRKRMVRVPGRDRYKARARGLDLRRYNILRQSPACRPYLMSLSFGGDSLCKR